VEPPSKKYPLTTITLFSIRAILLVIALFLLFAQSMTKPLDHDEHQFVASGKVFADHLFLPYRDYPYFHMPYLALIYAGLFTLSDHLLFAARLLSVACAWVTVLAVFFIALRVLKGRWRGLIAAGSLTLLVFNPAFAHTVGRAWNHEIGVLAALLAFLAHCHAIKTGVMKYFCLSGALIGLAIGIRLTFAPAALGFLLMLFIYSRPLKRSLFLFIFGLVVALLPLILLFAAAPEQFLFGNLEYSVRLNRAYWEELGRGMEMTFQAKVLHFMHLISSPGSLSVCFLFAFLLFSKNWFKDSVDRGHRFEFLFVLILLPLLLFGSFAPGLSFYYEYFYTPTTFAILGLVYALASLADSKVSFNLSLGLFGIVVLVSTIFGLSAYQRATTALSLQKWVPLNIHNTGRDLAARLGNNGKVLTLVPIYPLEGGADIYENLVTGPFAWRTGHLLSEVKGTGRSGSGVRSCSHTFAMIFAGHVATA
jgi:4-amino-4-deoxy-L-arabinose transferase-like glycosyltransferase